MTQGRHSEYKDEYVTKVDEYLITRTDEYFDYKKSWTSGASSESESQERKITVKLPTIEGFAIFVGAAISTIYAWEKLHPDFSKALDLIRGEQKNRLLDKGLNGDYNSTIAKLILSSNHGMTEKTATDHTTKGDKIESIPILGGITTDVQNNNNNKEDTQAEE